MNDSLSPTVVIESLKRETLGLHMRIGDLLAGVSGLYEPTTAMLLAGDAAIDRAGRANVTAGEVWMAMFKQALTAHLDRAVERCFGKDGERPADLVLPPDDEQSRSLMLAAMLADVVRERDALKDQVQHLTEQG